MDAAMYGIPSDLPLGAFVGREFNQVCLGRFQVQFHASGTGSVFAEGRWELRNAHGDLLDKAREHERRESYRIHEVIDRRIVGFVIDAPSHFTLEFEGGHRLSVFDDSEQYESVSIHLDGEPSIYI